MYIFKCGTRKITRWDLLNEHPVQTGSETGIVQNVAKMLSSTLRIEFTV